jgi:hypothetical protein
VAKTVSGGLVDETLINPIVIFAGLRTRDEVTWVFSSPLRPFVLWRAMRRSRSRWLAGRWCCVRTWMGGSFGWYGGRWRAVSSPRGRVAGRAAAELSEIAVRSGRGPRFRSSRGRCLDRCR